MKRPLVAVVLLLGLVAASSLAAQTKLTALVGFALPPYIIQESNSGYEMDVVKAALASAGYTIVPQYVPFARIAVGLQGKSADCALTINESSGVTGVYYSDTHVTYQNVVVTLKSRNLKVASLADLKSLSISAFQDAPLYLGPEFGAMAKANPKYTEIADQQAQVKLLFSGRVDAVVSDINIFKYFRQQVKDVDVSAEVNYAAIFGQTNYKVAFVSKDVCDKFNVGLKKLRDSGEYNSIYKRYIK